MTDSPVAHNHVAIIGTGFGGIATAIRLRQAGFEDVILIDRAGDVGGVWRDNDYPGAAVDVQSHLYSFSFTPNPNWHNTYAKTARALRLPRCRHRAVRATPSSATRQCGRTIGLGP
jgi:cation diffusion facilitator CzcD-associated flavoprotein CzcO